MPGQLGGMIELSRLELQNNTLSGTIPESWGSFLRLRVLQLQENDITGTVPDAICDFRKIDDITIRLVVLKIDCSSDKIECACCNEKTECQSVQSP